MTLSLSGFKGFRATMLKTVYRKKIDGKGFLPPPFHRTMAEKIDGRLDKMTQGLGVIVNDMGKYYPMKEIPKGGSIEDEWLGRRIRVERGEIDGAPKATWLDNGVVPMQLLTRWYGFSFTYPDCEIYNVLIKEAVKEKS